MRDIQRPVRILFVVGKFPELTFVFRTITALAARGHQITVVAHRAGDWKDFRDRLPLPSNLKVKYLLPNGGLITPIQKVPILFNRASMLLHRPQAGWKLWKTGAKQADRKRGRLNFFVRYLPFIGLPADVVQFDFPMTAATYSMLSALLGIPSVVSCRGADVHMADQREASERAARLDSIQRAAAVHCVSEEMAEEVRRLTGRTQGIWVNRPAVPIDEITAKVSYKTDKPPLIVAVGRLTWKKGFDYLLAALQRVLQAGCDFEALIIGGGEQYATMRFSIEDLGLSPYVKLTGNLPPKEVLDTLHRADVFVLSSHEEGISNAALEAMATGLPIVTTCAGGMDEAVRNGIDGFVVPVRDIAALADRMQRLLRDAELREQMGRSARGRVEAEFSLDRQVRVFEAMYTATMKS